MNMKMTGGMKAIGTRQKGFTLIEIAMVLAIIGVLIGGAVKGRDMFYQAKAISEIGDVQFIITHIQNKYRGIATTTGVTTASTIPGGIYPETMITTATTVTNQFGGAVTMAAANITGAGTGFQLTDGGMNRTVCQTVVNGLTAAVSRMTVVNGAGTSTVVHSTYGTLVAYSPAVADAACDSSSSNSIQFIFSKS